MILSRDITPIGEFVKTHGIDGELSLTLDPGLTPDDLPCMILDMDGIYVPFFVTASRTRGSQSWLVTLEGITSDIEAASMVGKTVYALRDRVEDDDTDDDGFYLEDMVGYTLFDVGNENPVGKIADVDLSTDNALFIVETDHHHRLMIPAAVDLMVAADHDLHTLTMNLPTGLADL